MIIFFDSDRLARAFLDVSSLTVSFLIGSLFLVLVGGCAEGITGSGGSSSDDKTPTNNDDDSKETVDSTGPANPLIVINGGETQTGQAEVNLSLSASDSDSGVTGYFLSTTSTAPDPAAAGWNNFPATNNFQESYLDATLDASGFGDKTLYVWFKDAKNNLSASANDTINFYKSSGNVKDSEQTICYNATRGLGVCIGAGDPFFGQDANYQGLKASYTIGQGKRSDTVRDNVTGLVWKRRSNAFGSGGVTLSQLRTICANLNLGGYSDWRVPSAREALQIARHGFDSPSYPTPFSFADNAYIWSETVFSRFAGRNWLILNEGSSSSVSETQSGASVLETCVRGVASPAYRFTARGLATPDVTDDTVIETVTGLTWDRRETNIVNWEDGLEILPGFHPRLQKRLATARRARDSHFGRLRQNRRARNRRHFPTGHGKVFIGRAPPTILRRRQRLLRSILPWVLTNRNSSLPNSSPVAFATTDRLSFAFRKILRGFGLLSVHLSPAAPEALPEG